MGDFQGKTHEEVQRKKDTLLKLKEDLICQVCGEFFPGTLVYTCENLHSVCWICHCRDFFCSVCNGRLTDKRNHTIENILSHMPNDVNSGGIESIDFLPKLKELLECPVCLRPFPSLPIYTCENLHGLCQSCRQRAEGKPCPVCRGELTDKRNELAEKILTLALPMMDCKFTNCNFKTHDSANLQEHIENGPHRSVNCGFCNTTMSLSELPKHLETGHRSKKFQMKAFGRCCSHDSCQFRRTNIKRESDMEPYQQLFEVEGSTDTFFSNWINIGDQHKMFWVSYAGDKRKALNYQYTLKVYNQGDSPYPLIFSGTRACVPCDISREEMANIKCGFVLDVHTLKSATCKNHQGKIHYTLIVSKVV